MLAARKLGSLALLCASFALFASEALARRGAPPWRFQVEEATIADIHEAILSRKLTATELVHLYLERIKAYNGTCVNEPEGILGPISTIPDAGKLNALITLNLRPKSRLAWGFDERKARSMTDPIDDDPAMPDALETAAALDRYVAQHRKLIGPLHGVVIAIKDQYDTFDMRTTSGADAFWANDRPPDDATFVKRLRDAGAIILAKANMGEYAAGGVTGTRSSFGGTMCNAYDTERDPGASSGGSGMAVAANFVTCAIGEETGTSVREPAKNNNAVGLAPTRELVSADGMIQQGLTTRVGPICRTVADTAKILDAYAGFDPADELTAFAVGRKPPKPYAAYATKRRLDGYTVGVVREYMDRAAFTVVDEESIALVEDAVDDLRQLGARIVDPGEGGALFQGCFDRYWPVWNNRFFIGQFPDVFPVDTDGEPTSDHIASLVDMFFDPSLVPHDDDGSPTLRDFGPSPGDTGGGRYNFEVYIRERGDPEIRSLAELVAKQNYWTDPVIPPRNIASSNLTLATGSALQTRFTLQTTLLQCFGELGLDAIVYPTGSVPPAILTAPQEPSVNGRGSSIWTAINSRGFPAMTVPAGFTTVVYDRAQDGSLLPPIPKALPVGIDFLGRPFGEHTLFAIASAYEAATHHRRQPPAFGPLDDAGKPPYRPKGKPRAMPKWRWFGADELRESRERH
jgi:Asp-tRNA(Asn)/Glu-tRNA(Gln) amidotransferase A subunit family amidase